LKICIVGAGAIGGFIGTRVALAGRAAVSALARGDTLQALRTQGWRLQTASGLQQAPAHAEDDPAALGPQDLVVLTVKAPALSELAPRLAPLIGPQTLVLPAMNGVPWWFCQGLPGWQGQPLRSVDPHGHIATALPLGQVLGCVVHASAAMLQPGLVQHRVGQGLIVGECTGGHSARAQAVVDVLAQAGFEATQSQDIRRDIWFKLWGNMTMNPVSAITGATADLVLADPLVRAFNSAAMTEAAAIGALIGCPITQTPEERHAVTARLGAFKTSMLQDVQAGRAIELDALVGAVREIAGYLQVPTPTIDALMGLTRLFARAKGLYPA
jgi:2-dehydropantoate 2-reductase